MTVQLPLSACLITTVFSFWSCWIALLTSILMLLGYSLCSSPPSLVFIISKRSSMVWGRVGIVPPVILLNAQLHLCSNLSKNSSRSGSSLGDGENLSPSCRASLWLGVKMCDDKFRMESSMVGSNVVLLVEGEWYGLLLSEVLGCSAED